MYIPHEIDNSVKPFYPNRIIISKDPDLGYNMYNVKIIYAYL